MKRVRSRIWAVLLGFTFLSAGAAAPGQEPGGDFPPAINTEQNPLRNVRASGSRAPGQMVNAGVTRTLAAASFARRVIEITEPMPEPDAKATFLIEAIEIVFEQLNNAILLFENALRLRAGLPPRVPIDLTPTPPTDTTDQGDATGDETTDAPTVDEVQEIIDRLN